MVELSEFRTDTRAINDGVWERVDEARYGDLDILSRGFTDEFIDAQNARLTKAAEQFSGDRTRIPNSVARQINASLIEDFLVIDVRNLRDGERVVTVAEFHMMLYDPAYNRLARACWEAASRVTTRSAAQMDAAKGNSHAPSVTTSTGVISGNA